MTLAFAPERIETWPLERLQPYAKNAKAHGADQVAKIAASMAEFGWTVPCLVGEDGELIAGHGRVLAATQLGLTEAPVIVLGHLTEMQRRACSPALRCQTVLMAHRSEAGPCPSAGLREPDATGRKDAATDRGAPLR
jgi:hypothetical protein